VSEQQPSAGEAASQPAAPSPDAPVPPDVAWARGFQSAARTFAEERGLREIHIEITLADGERFPVISIGPGGPPGFIGFGVETEGLRERMEEGGREIRSPRGVYVPAPSVTRIEFSAEPAEKQAVGFWVDRELDRS
jgi:hypothetical protein